MPEHPTQPSCTGQCIHRHSTLTCYIWSTSMVSSSREAAAEQVIRRSQEQRTAAAPSRPHHPPAPRQGRHGRRPPGLQKYMRFALCMPFAALVPRLTRRGQHRRPPLALPKSVAAAGLLVDARQALLQAPRSQAGAQLLWSVARGRCAQTAPVELCWWRRC